MRYRPALRRLAPVVIVLALLALVRDLRAQGPAALPPPSAPNTLAFEVASVKRNTGNQPLVRVGGAPGTGRFEMINVPLPLMLQLAYGVQAFQVVNLPSWASSTRFDVNAKAPADVASNPAANPMMLRSLLAERFKLTLHEETREMPIYALVPLKKDAPTERLTVSTTDCDALFASRRGGPPPAPPQPNEPMQCGTMMGPGIMNVGAGTMEQLARNLSGNLGRVVLDRTGLTGRYDFRLTYTPDQLPQAPPGGLPPGVGPLPTIDPNGPSLFTAVQEQLGLKLDSDRGPVKVLVIDRVDLPTED